MTIPFIATWAFLDRDTNYNTSNDYLRLVVIQAVMFLLFECVGHLRHRKRLQARHNPDMVQGLPRG